MEIFKRRFAICHCCCLDLKILRIEDFQTKVFNCEIGVVLRILKNEDFQTKVFNM